ncbi:MAG: amino acid adenylation domain-containing protein [Okeania sp. SIO2G4]|uniref:amino acid adenylation domain-containing protein n=1 Tax=unclassified Okeania TaxID=2634635 RepID=UPI0013BD0C9F|nr:MULTISPECIES: amino acid adenylation domain-containing protein [unclassified Okeania]NEP72546.1 amino acid adenylation domain-containing protein [Okeania sp. SIO2G5]NEP94138.1 amino acid adenylation domain-containing protein [Okeania sp. SIO2F5]NEQ91255.1 amino acid adenylation domain-containing protein [Okeania sp. SIO2G4]
MTVNELLNELSENGVKLWVDGEQLRIQAAKGLMTPERREIISEHKAEIIERLQQNEIGASVSYLPTITPQPEQRYEPFPLTDIQYAYWVGRMGVLELGDVANHGYYELERVGLKIDRLNQALNQLIQRHDMLRSVVLPEGLQKVFEEVPPYEISTLDLRGKDDDFVQAQIDEIRNILSHQVLPTDKWPLFEFRATLLDGERLRLHFSYDVQIFDGWSMMLLFKEWMELYQNPESLLPALEITFRDCVLAEEKLQNTELFKRSQQYWLNRIDSLPPAPEIPLVKNPSSLKNYQCQRFSGQLSPETWQNLKQRGGEVGLTPSGILLAAFAEVLTLWGKSPKFTVNVALLNRLPLHPQVNDILGDFTSVNLLAVDNSGTETFTNRALRLQRQLWQDLEHRYFSGVRVMREINRRQGGNPVAMPIVFTSAIGQENYVDKFGELVYAISQASQVWMDHQVTEHNGKLVFNWDVVIDLFPEGLIDDMFGAYCNLLECMAKSDEIWSETSREYLMPANQLLQRAEVNTTEMPISEATLYSLFVQQAKIRGNEIAVISGERSLTYNELYKLSTHLGEKLQYLGAVPNRLIAIVMEKGWEQVVATLGILASGAAYLPISAKEPKERLQYLLENSDVEIVLTQSYLTDIVLPNNVKRIDVDTFNPSIDEPDNLKISATPDNLAYVIYTSGSTGLPKGVTIDHRGAVNTILDINQRFGVEPSDRILAVSALNFDLSVYDIFGVLAAGASMVIPSATGTKDPSEWIELIETHGITLWNSVPALMQMLVEYVSARTEIVSSSLRLALLSGDWLPLSLPPEIKSVWPDIKVISLGGATEASIWSIYYPIETINPDWKSVPYGKPLLNQRFYVLDDCMETRPVFVPGQLYIGGVGLAVGYWKNEQKTQASFITHPKTQERLYKTGDLGRYLPDGNIEFLGREDFQVKINGHRIELGEIEAALKRYPGIKEVVISVFGEEQHKKGLVAYVVFNQELASSQNAAEAYQPSQQEGVLTDPLERIEFKLKQPGLEQLESSITSVELPETEVDENLMQAYLERQSYREFLYHPLSLKQLSKFLSCLQQMKLNDYPLPKYRYPSAGNLYPVQTYLFIKPNRVEGLEGGLYYYHPADHRLMLLSSTSEIDGKIYGGNQPIFEQSAFSIFLIGKLDAISPMYGELAKDFSLLEAGHIGQLLMSSAPKQEIGLCPVGHVEFDELQDLLKLKSSQVLLYSFVGGKIDLAQTKQWFKSKAAPGTRSLSVELREYLQDKLPKYMVPAEYITLETLPLTANGKIDRRSLPQPQINLLGKDANYAPPQTKIEHTVVKIWEEVLGLEKVGVNDNFFDIGGNSLQVTKIYNKLREVLPNESENISLVDIFNYATIAKLSEQLSQNSTEEKDDQLKAKIQAGKDRMKARFKKTKATK